MLLRIIVNIWPPPSKCSKSRIGGFPPMHETRQPPRSVNPLFFWKCTEIYFQLLGVWGWGGVPSLAVMERVCHLHNEMSLQLSGFRCSLWFVVVKIRWGVPTGCPNMLPKIACLDLSEIA